MVNPLSTCWNWICNRFRRIFFPLLLRYIAKPLKAGQVYRLTPWTVVKNGTEVRCIQEVEGLQFVRQHTSIPVPKFYDLWPGERSPWSGQRYSWIAMEYIEGERVDRSQRIPSITPEQKKTICRILAGYIDQLRAIKQPTAILGQIASPSGGPSRDFRVGDAIIPAFKTVRDYHDWRISTFARWGEAHEPTSRRLEELRASMDDNCRVVFTHGDISKQNVLIRRWGEGPEDLKVVALLDWEQSGWRPEHWEVSKIAYTTSAAEWWMDISTEYKKELRIENELLYISGHP